VAFMILAGLEGAILILAGSYSVAVRATGEVASGTLDFHRASPTPVTDQAIGLVLGPPATAWICFALGAPTLLLCAALGSVSLLGGFMTLLSLMCSALFFHLVTAAAGLSQKKGANAKASPQGWGWAVLILLLMVNFFPSWEQNPLPAFAGSVPVILHVIGVNQEQLRHAFFGLNLPPLVTQIIVQAPLMAMAALAARRAIRYPDRPALSKRVALALAGWLFILFTAATVGSGTADWNASLEEFCPVGAMLFAMLIGGCLLVAVTPSYGLYCGGLRRRAEGLVPRGQFLDDAAGNGGWSLLFMAITLAFYAAVWIGRGMKELLWMPPAAMALYFGWFAQSLEYFRLRPAQRKGTLFPLLLAVLWVILPIIGVIAVSAAEHWTACSAWLASACPLFGILQALKEAEVPRTGPLAVFTVNLALFVLFAILAHTRRRAIARRIESARKPSTPSP